MQSITKQKILNFPLTKIVLGLLLCFAVFIIAQQLVGKILDVTSIDKNLRNLIKGIIASSVVILAYIRKIWKKSNWRVFKQRNIKKYPFRCINWQHLTRLNNTGNLFLGWLPDNFGESIFFHNHTIRSCIFGGYFWRNFTQGNYFSNSWREAGKLYLISNFSHNFWNRTFTKSGKLSNFFILYRYCRLYVWCFIYLQ